MNLFSPIAIGNLTLRNRVVMAPMSGNQASPDGSQGAEVAEYYAQRALGGVALIVTGALFVTPPHPDSPRRFPSLHTDEMIPGLNAIVEAVHAGGAAVFGQLASTLWPSGDMPVDWRIEQVQQLREDFVAAAVRARRAGCDGIELHMAHYSTLADFISRGLNRRNDRYGGTLDGRARLAVEIVAGIRRRLGPDYPISCRFCADECMMGGNTLKETIPLARMLVDAGATMLSVSAGGRLRQGGEYSYFRAYPMHDWPDAMNAYLGEEIRRAVHVPVAVAGKIGGPQVAETVLQRGQADLIALGRALLADPDWANKAREGRWDEINACIYCRYCRDSTEKGEPIRCVKTPAPSSDMGMRAGCMF